MVFNDSSCFAMRFSLQILGSGLPLKIGSFKWPVLSTLYWSWTGCSRGSGEGLFGPGPPIYPKHVGIFKAKEFTMSANQGQISAGPPQPNPGSARGMVVVQVWSTQRRFHRVKLI